MAVPQLSMIELRDNVIGEKTLQTPIGYCRANVAHDIQYRAELVIPDPLLVRHNMDISYMQCPLRSGTPSQVTMVYTAVLIHRLQYSDFVLLATGFKQPDPYRALSSLHDFLVRCLFNIVQEKARLEGALVFQGAGANTDGFYTVCR